MEIEQGCSLELHVSSATAYRARNASAQPQYLGEHCDLGTSLSFGRGRTLARAIVSAVLRLDSVEVDSSRVLALIRLLSLHGRVGRLSVRGWSKTGLDLSKRWATCVFDIPRLRSRLGMERTPLFRAPRDCPVC